jgi:hypothetical protein
MYFSRFRNIQEVKLKDIFGFSLLFLVTVGTFIFLFVNHLPFARQTELIIKGKQLNIIGKGKADSIPFSEITSIKEYATSKTPWSSIKKWKIEAGGKEYVISSLTISPLNFDRQFLIKLKQKFRSFRQFRATVNTRIISLQLVYYISAVLYGVLTGSTYSRSFRIPLLHTASFRF